MGRFDSRDDMYSRAIANIEGIGVGDHVITNHGLVGVIQGEEEAKTFSLSDINTTTVEQHWTVLITDRRFKDQTPYKQRVPKKRCVLAVRTDRPGSGIRLRCLCGCNSLWMEPELMEPSTVDKMGDIIKGMSATDWLQAELLKAQTE